MSWRSGSGGSKFETEPERNAANHNVDGAFLCAVAPFPSTAISADGTLLSLPIQNVLCHLGAVSWTWFWPVARKFSYHCYWRHTTEETTSCQPQAIEFQHESCWFPIRAGSAFTNFDSCDREPGLRFS